MSNIVLEYGSFTDDVTVKRILNQMFIDKRDLDWDLDKIQKQLNAYISKNLDRLAASYVDNAMKNVDAAFNAKNWSKEIASIDSVLLKSLIEQRDAKIAPHLRALAQKEYARLARTKAMRKSAIKTGALGTVAVSAAGAAAYFAWDFLSHEANTDEMIESVRKMDSALSRTQRDLSDAALIQEAKLTAIFSTARKYGLDPNELITSLREELSKEPTSDAISPATLEKN